MVRSIIVTLLGVSMAASCQLVHAAELEKAQVEFETLARELPNLDLDSVLYDRLESRSRWWPETGEVHQRVLEKVTDVAYTKETLLKLLKHEDAKVRTLAAVALFDREDPSVLPALVELCDDDAATFPAYMAFAYASFDLPKKDPPTVDQTVANVAAKMVAFYMGRAGYQYGVKHKTQPGFAEYWEARQDRSHCASWFAVKLARASQSRFPVRETRIPLIKEIHQQIGQLPPDERAWNLLWLSGENGRQWLVSDEELVEICQALGPEKLLRMLENNIPSDDPDLQPQPKSNSYYQLMQMFVLRHADQLLRPEDADALLACERWQRDYLKHGISDPLINPWWAIGAAHLQPKDASRVLHSAMQRFQGEFDSRHQAAIAIALWQLCGVAEKDFIVDWFYEVAPDRGAFPHCRGQFIVAMQQETNGREIVTQIIQDKRLDRLDWQSLDRLVHAVNAWEEKPIFTQDQLRQVWHPLGEGHYHWEKGKAQIDFPKETAELERHLQTWRTRLLEWASAG
ncbi:HEAT repeat domain-containing protein [Bremerella sp.]|uniref:HEAT repeat domain-containing protein n=1 Tax=Bremerella sp. TaxID=2795602 RepID=UPI00391AF5A7